MADQLPRLFSDEPQEDASQLGFNFPGYAKTIADIIGNPANRSPLVVGVYGEWGSGKTTLMKTIETQLQQQDGVPPYRACKTVWFQAWKYADEDAILAALIEEIFKSMEGAGGFTWTKASMEKLADRFQVKQVFSDFTKAVTIGTVDLEKWFAEPAYRAKLGFYDVFQRFFERLLWAYVTPSGLPTDQRFDDQKGVLVIFIDDLDRCPKDRIVKILETLKLFLDKQGCVFVIGAAREVLESALSEKRYTKLEAQQFMDKIVQVTFTLPKVHDDALQAFLAKEEPQNPLLTEFGPMLARVLRSNVRAVKRFLNDLRLSEGLLRNAEPPLALPSDALMRWSILQYAYPGLAKLIKENPVNVSVWQGVVKELEEKGLQAANWNLADEQVQEVTIPASLKDYLTKREVVDLMEGFPSDAATLNSMVSMSGTATTLPEEVQAMVTRESKGLGVEMVTIPKGDFLYGENNISQITENDFRIDIYPVTNEQFRRFVEIGGYTETGLWSDEGWKWRTSAGVHQPKYWEDEQWNRSDHPVVGVCWYEAEAYAKWAGKRLPTEEEWEKAARGTEGRVYPWGDDFDQEKCNTYESNLGGTTPVTKYVNSLSPYGCYDMAGNVWEWTASLYEEKQTHRVLRGGSWNYEPIYARSADRYWIRPTFRDNYVGFRCVQDAP